VATFAVFYPVLNHWFVYWDDDFFILRNADLDPPTLTGLAKFWSNPMHGYNQFLVPLNYTIWWALAHVARTPGHLNNGSTLNAPAFHALNLSFHMLAAALAFLLLRKLVKSDWAAAAGAAFFALNPLQAEPVSWASNMYTPLSGALALGALLAYFSSIERPGKSVGRWGMFGISTLCFVLALLSKPSVVMLPLIAMAIQLFLLGGRVRDCAPLAIWLLIGGADALITHHIHAGTNAFQPPLWQRPFVAGDALAFYLGKLVLPINLIPDYGRPPARVLAQWTTYVIWIFPVATLLACWLVRRRFPWLLCGAAIFVLGVFPMLGLAPFDFQGFSTVADRYLYLSLLGASLIISFAIKQVAPTLMQTRWRSAAVAAPLAVILILATLCRAQVNYWEDTGSLFHRTLQVNPRSEVAHLQLGYVLLNRGGPTQLEEALDHYLAVLEVRPKDAPLLFNIALTLCKLDRPAEAIPFLQAACTLAPRVPTSYYMLADALNATHNRPAAIAAFTETFRRFPGFADTELRIARLLAESNNATAAISHYKSYLRTHPNSAEARFAISRLQSSPAQAATDGR
jgi:tetratricopeptide (TPR) repeat protein